MGIFDFVKDAGSSIFGPSDEEKAAAAAKEAQASAEAQASYEAVLAQLNADTSAKLTKMVGDMGFDTSNLDIGFDSAQNRVTLMGSVPSQSDREKIVLLVGNNQGVAQVDDQLSVEAPEPEATFYTVVKGDTLSKIAKAHYGDAMKYPQIFEANRPMLKSADLIYPGQVLRIPPA